MKKMLKFLLLIVAMFVCTVSAFSQNRQAEICAYAYIPIKDSNGKIQKYRGLGETISKTDLLNATELLVEDFGAGYVIKSFVVYAYIERYHTEMSCGGHKFYEGARNSIFMKMNKYHTCYIQDIKVVGKDGVERQLPPIILRIR